MPYYDYVCEACGWDFTLKQSIHAADKDAACPRCGEKKARKVLSPFSTSSCSGSVCGLGSGGWGGG